MLVYFRERQNREILVFLLLLLLLLLFSSFFMAKGSNTFRLSDLMPYSWFYKLKNMRSRGNRVQKAKNSKSKSQISRTEPLQSPTIQDFSTNRFSHYITSEERAAEQLSRSPTRPTKSMKKPKKKLLSSPVLNAQPSHETPLHSLDDRFDAKFFTSSSDIFVAEPNHPLPPPPPILTKPRLINGRKQSPKQGSRSPSATQQIKLRIKSPKLVQKRLLKRKGLTDSFVVVKYSSDPKGDFRESMVDMIVENNLFSLKELEELLSCYLLLNSSEYHDLIVEVFEKIWSDITEVIV
ncbi:hypothetical protein KFK09_000722 [Dendrobium nobile]|uniref:Transcription repressor n=1 Tax=Dendrobium nobile TaxID=94219 RepID=A0A8T3CEP8_DENNO|nr:hypothetical protein KFK09_000722 [Dendrobium nobile]